MKEVPKPDEAAYLQEKNATQSKLNEVISKIASITHQIDTLSDERKKAVDARKLVQDEQAKLKSQRSEAIEKSGVAQQQLDQIEKQRAEKRRALEQHKAGLKFTKVEDLDLAVQKIQLKLTTGNLPREVQQKLLADLNGLKSQRQKVLAYAAMRQLAEAEKVDTDGINKQIEKEAGMTRELREQERKLQKDYTDNKKVEQTTRKQIEGLLKTRKSLAKERAEYTSAISNLEYNYTKQERAYTRYIEAVKYFKRKEAREKRAAREAEWKESAAEEVEEKIVKVPYAKEIQICEDLTRYLNSLLGVKETETKVAVEEKTVDVVSIAATRSANFKGKNVVAAAKDGDKIADEWVSAAREAFGQKKKRVRAKKEKQVINHIPDIFAQFKTVQVEPPLLKSGCEAALEALAKRKLHYETVPPPEAKDKNTPAKGTTRGESDDSKTEQLEQQERSKNRRKSLQLIDAEQQRRITELAEAAHAALNDQGKERIESIKKATQAVAEEQQRRVAEAQKVVEEEIAERKLNQRRASAMLDEEQKRRIAEYQEKVAHPIFSQEKAGKGGKGDQGSEDALTSQVQVAEKARSAGGNDKGGKSKKQGKSQDQGDGDLTSQLQAAEKERTSNK